MSVITSLLLLFFIRPSFSYSQPQEHDTLTIISLTDGREKIITREQRDLYRFFSAIDNFETATVFMSPSSRFYVRFTRRKDNNQFPDTLVEYSGDFLTSYKEVFKHYEELLRGDYIMGSDTTIERLRTGVAPSRTIGSAGHHIQDSVQNKMSLTVNEEELIPLIEARKIYRINDEMDVKLHLFSEYEGFKDASLFKVQDSLYALEIFRNVNGTTRKIRTLMDEEEMRLLRTKIYSRLLINDPNAGINQSGRSKFLGNIYSISIGLYGWGIPYLLDMSGSAAVGTYLLLNAASVLIANAATENSEISEETANLTIFGTGLGLTHGIMLSLILNENSPNLKTYVALSMLGSGIEGFAAYQIGRKVSLSGSQIELIGTASAFGIFYSFGTSVLMDVKSTSGVATSLFLGSIAGTFIGSMLIENPIYTSGNLNIVRGSFILGTYIPLTVLIAAEASNSKAYVATAMAGGLVGALIGKTLIQKKNFSSEEGLLIMSGILGGALIGGGIPTLANANAKVSLVVSGIGAFAGYAVMYSKYSGTAEQRTGTSSFNFSFHPEGLFAFVERKQRLIPMNNIVPAARLSFQF